MQTPRATSPASLKDSGCRQAKGSESVYEFGAFQLDCEERLLLHKGRPVALKGKPFELLVLLVQSAGHTLRKSDLMRALWPDVSVHENNLAVAIRSIRRALLSHDSSSPVIETMHRHGYRLVWQVRIIEKMSGANFAISAAPSPAALTEVAKDYPFVGREVELKQLSNHWAATLQGQGRVVLISGEPGIGKSALTCRFLAQAQFSSSSNCVVLTGCCHQIMADSEPYLPWMEALSSGLKGPVRPLLLESLKQHAPGWLARLPPAVRSQRTTSEPSSVDSDSGVCRWQATTASPKELVDALLGVSALRPLVIVLEDLHWTNAASIDVLRLLEARVATQRTLVLGTYRPAEVDDREPLGLLLLDLAYWGRLADLSIARLEPEHLQRYLDDRFDTHTFEARQTAALWRKTEGLPLFVVCLLRSMVDTGQLYRAADGPWQLEAGVLTLGLSASGSISALMRKQLQRLTTAERRTLDVACILGEAFGVTLMAHLLDEDPVDTEERLARLAQLHRLLFLRKEPVFGDGGSEVQFRFHHVLLQEFLYEELASNRRCQLHRLAGCTLLQLNPDTSRLQPSRLAVHFDKGQDPQQAALYFILAGDQADRAFAHQEALAFYERARELVKQLGPRDQAAPAALIHHGQGWANVCLQRLTVAGQHFDELARLAEDMQSPHEPPEQSSLESAFHYFRQPWSQLGMELTAGIFPIVACGEFSFELLAESLHCRCHVLSIAEDVENLGERAQELQDLSIAHGSTPRQSEGLGWLGLHALYEGRLEEARDLLDTGLALARSLNHERGLRLSLGNRANLYLMQCEFAFAQTAYEEWLARATSADQAAEAQLGLGQVLAKQGFLQAALDAYGQAQQLMQRRQTGFPSLHGWILREIGQLDAARRHDELALSALNHDHPPSLRVRLLASLAETCCRLNDLTAATQHLNEAEALVRPDPARVACRTPIQMARCALLQRRQQLDLLEKEANTWCELSTNQDDHEGTLYARQWLVRSALDRGKIDLAGSQMESLFASFMAHPVPLADWLLEALKAELFVRQGDAHGALCASTRAWQCLHALTSGLDKEQAVSLKQLGECVVGTQPKPLPAERRRLAPLPSKEVSSTRADPNGC